MSPEERQIGGPAVDRGAVAALAGADEVAPAHVAEALAYRSHLDAA
jgi:hypothetical protein